MRTNEYPRTSALPALYVVGILILLAVALTSVGCSRQITPQEQREQLRAAQEARGEVAPAPAERAPWVSLNGDVDKMVDPDTGNVCYRLNGNTNYQYNRFDCVQGK